MNNIFVFLSFPLQLRFQKCVDAHPELMQKVTASEQEKIKEKSDKDKDKVGWILGRTIEKRSHSL